MPRVARDYLLIPLTKVRVERVFSGAGDVLGLRRQSMSADTIRSLVLLKDHYDSRIWIEIIKKRSINEWSRRDIVW